jgi:hypothetical protein
MWKRRFTKITLCRIISQYLSRYFAAPLKGHTMTVNLSPLAGAGWQFFDSNGVPLSGGLLYTYAAGTSTPAVTYTSATGVTANANPIVLNSAGRPPSQVWLDSSATYKFVLATAANVTIWTMDNIPGIASFVTTTIANLPSISPSAGSIVFVTNEGREGQFICRAGTAPSDPLQGIYVPSNTANFYWERVWDNINGYPEWFGAITNNAAVAATNVTAIHACLALCPVVNFAEADYWVNATLKFNVPYRTIQGCAISDGYNTGNGTRIVSTNASANIIQVGPDTAPAGGTSAYFRNITVKYLSTQYGVALTPPSAGNESSAVKNWLVQYVLNNQIINCAAWEPIIGFYFYGAVYTKVDDCTVFRSTTYGGTNDFFRGFWPQGGPPILAGGNPSLYLNRCNVAMGGAPALVSPTGLFINADFSDIFVDDLETSQVPNGIIVNGAGSVVAGGKLDLHIRNVILDQCNGSGIQIIALNAMSMVTINGGYVQINDTGVASAGIVVSGSVNNGAVSIGGGLQLLSGVGTSNRGIYISQQSNVKVDSTVMIEDFYTPIDIDGGAVNIDVAATINNPNTGNSLRPAVNINVAERVRVSCSVDGKSGAFAQGVLAVGTGLNKAIIDPTLFDPTAIGGGAVNKVLVNSVQITSPGYYTTAGVAGTSGAGVFVTGITA